MKKRSCWFSHNHSIPSGYVLAHIHGKLTRAPIKRDVLLLLKCTDCDHIKTVFYKEIEAAQEKIELEKLNQSLNLNSKDIPYVNQVTGDISCGF